MNSLEH